MMVEFTEGSDIHLIVPLMRNDIPVIPDTNSVTFTVYDASGAAIVDHTDVAVPTGATTTQLALPIAASVNTIAVGKSFEHRMVVVKFTQAGQKQRFQATYRVVPFLKHVVTPEKVRSFIGVKSNELPDQDIDLTSAYFTTQNDFLPATLADKLSAGDLSELAANEAIRMRAVLDVLPSLRQRIAQQESNGVWQFQRAQIGKFDNIEKEARLRYTHALETASGITPVNLSYVLVTLDPDPVTRG